jgi:hypothetical protein
MYFLNESYSFLSMYSVCLCVYVLSVHIIDVGATLDVPLVT